MEEYDINQEAKFAVSSSRYFSNWLAEHRISLGFTTYRSNKLFLLGSHSDGQLSVSERSFPRCMGLYSDGNAQTLYLGTDMQIWRFERANSEGELYQDYDAIYIPQHSHVTGELDAHDISVTDNKQVIFVNTLFSCLANVSDTHSFKQVWQPPFISELAPEDRCHLNGLAMDNGKPRYMTSVSQSNIERGWRKCRREGGLLLDIQANGIVAAGLSMPHSPRLYRDKLWMLNSGAGYFGSVDISSGQFERTTFCPGYARGLAFIGDYAVVGLSKPRRERAFEGLPLQETLTKYNTDARCGLLIIDLNSGEVVHSLYIEGIIRELYDVSVLAGVSRPMALGFKSNEIRRFISIDA
ncbi:MAG: TIGR03032 family protein [Candidatus Sedimenticola sp. (ex Thyasira tokunagai)]